MELKKLIGKCSDALQEMANTSEDTNETENLSTKVDTSDGSIDLYYYRDKKAREWLCEAIVNHDDNEHESTNLQSFLEDQLAECVDWDAAEEYWRECSYDEWELHGFRDAADYYRWSYGFRDATDYYRWRYGGTRW